jgi:catechol 2,3-dioxygenase-like lactoylglutathione lyase family enzyme
MAKKKAKAAKPRAGKAASKAKQRTGKPAKKAGKVRKAPTRKSAAVGSAAARKGAPAVDRRKHDHPETLRLRAVMPGFTVNDIQKSLAYYRDVLGFHVKERWEEAGVLRGAELAAGSTSFYLGQDDWKKGKDRVKGVGFRIYCTTTQEIDALADGIRRRGGRLSEEPTDRAWGSRDFAIEDPDGFKITISSITKG